MDPKNNKKPWYTYPMVWFVIALPTIAVIASIATLIIASNNAPQLVNHQDTSYQTEQSKTNN